MTHQHWKDEMDRYETMARKLTETETDLTVIRSVLVLRGCVEPLATRYAQAAVRAARKERPQDSLDGCREDGGTEDTE